MGESVVMLQQLWKIHC